MSDPACLAVRCCPVSRWLLVLASLALPALVSSCSAIGPKTVPRDQFDYNDAIATSSQEQLLLNLVRLRYNESPVFLRVSSVISQYSRVGSVDAGAGLNTTPSGENGASAGARLTWIDRPTITYTPVTGQEFSRNLLTPLPPGRLLEMLHSSWPPDLVLRLATWSVNSLDNDFARPAARREADPELFELFELWQRLAEAAALRMRRPAPEDGGELTLYVKNQDQSEAVNADIARFFELLDLDPNATAYPLSYGSVADAPNGIAVQTGSILDILINLSWQFDVPAEHIESGRTDSTFESAHHAGRAPLEVLHSAEPPDDAFVKVRAQDYWFYIAQDDRKSKRTFAFLQLLLALAETETSGAGPLVTISS